MDFKYYLLEHLKHHHSMQPQDIVKLCYQSAFGCEHLLKDITQAQEIFKQEFEEVEAKDMPLYELISDDFCRIHLASWKNKGYPIEWLFSMFAQSFTTIENAKEMFLSYLKQSTLILKDHGYEMNEWNDYLKEYKKQGIHAVHHSLQYHFQEKPAYRLVHRQYLRLLDILAQVHQHATEDHIYVIAIDGRAASGKTTMAKQLQNILKAEVIHMDDFFLPLHLRNKERFQIPGSNVHYERFQEEVLPYLSLPQSFSYRIFDCSQMDYHGTRQIHSSKIRIVEGSYSCHPVFGHYAHLTVFSNISSKEQILRIQNRNGKEMAKVFQNKWIPLEEKYFSYYFIPKKSDLIL